jgi:hypothetical protein
LDPSGEQVAEYFARIVSWYTQGGFTDENGKYHHSGYHYELPWWEILNEVDGSWTPERYTRLSDAIIAAVRKVSPKTKFLGLSLGAGSPEFFEYWLNAENHRPGTPLDMMAFHFYACPAEDIDKYNPSPGQTINDWQYSYFDQAAGFVEVVRYVNAIRKRLSPATRINLNEVGTYVPGDFDPVVKDLHIPPAYWNLSAGVFAFLYAELSKQGVEILAESLLATGPGLAPGNTMINWENGKPNARFHVVKLLNDNFAPGDRLVETVTSVFPSLSDVAVQGFVTPKGRKILLINKRMHPVEVSLESDRGVEMYVVDGQSGESPARREVIKEQRLPLAPFAVAVVNVGS